MVKGSYRKSLFFNPETITPELSYLMGFIWADGYIPKRSNSLNIEVSKADGDELLHVFPKEVPWKIYYRHRAGRSEQMKFHLTDKEFKSFLIDNDFNKKSTIAPLLLISILSDNNKKFFYRGIFDGDGCVYSTISANQLSISSSYNQDWKHFENLCKSLEIDYNIQRVQGQYRSSSIRVTNLDDIKKIYEHLYLTSSNPILGLNRKTNHMVELFEKEDRRKYNGRKKVPKHSGITIEI